VESKQRKRDLAKTPAALNIAALSIGEAVTGASLLTNPIGENISAAPHIISNFLPLFPSAEVINIDSLTLSIFNSAGKFGSESSSSSSSAAVPRDEPSVAKALAMRAPTTSRAPAPLYHKAQALPIPLLVNARSRSSGMIRYRIRVDALSA